MAKVQMATMPVDVVNKVMGVLANLPYAQVAEVIQMVQQNVRVTEEEVPDSQVPASVEPEEEAA